MPRHELTDDDRRRGAQAAAEVKREKREAARQLALERLSGMTEKALTRLETLLLAESDADAHRAVKEVLDRVLGRPGQTVEISGADGEPLAVEVKHSVDDLAAVASILANAGVLSAGSGTDS